MDSLLLEEILNFIRDCDSDFLKGKFNMINIEKATHYLFLIESKYCNSEYLNAIRKKLFYIKNQIEIFIERKSNDETLLTLLPLNITDYIVALVKERKLVDPILISRFVYRELSSVLYYNVTYALTNDDNLKKEIWHTKVDEKREKIFSYVICTQWYDLYSHILFNFGISVKKMVCPNRKEHVWGEIELDNGYIIIVDATEYINSSIDLSNAKSLNPTVGYVILPKAYSGINLFNIFKNGNDTPEARKIKKCYEINRELDTRLNYIKNGKYPSEYIIENNDIFAYPKQYIYDKEKFDYLFKKTITFFKNLFIPCNIDGYEIYAYYSSFIKHLPLNVKSNISQKTLYVDTFEYNQDNTKNNRFLNAPKQYKEYLYNLLLSTYYSYLSRSDKDFLLDQIKSGITTPETLVKQIYDLEIKLAEVNRRINSYYAINQLTFYNPLENGEISSIQIYEPLMNKKNFTTIEEYEVFMKRFNIKKR